MMIKIYVIIYLEREKRLNSLVLLVLWVEGVVSPPLRYTLVLWVWGFPYHIVVSLVGKGLEISELQSIQDDVHTHAMLRKIKIARQAENSPLSIFSCHFLYSLTISSEYWSLVVKLVRIMLGVSQKWTLNVKVKAYKQNNYACKEQYRVEQSSEIERKSECWK